LRIARATLTPIRIPLRRAVVTAHGEHTAREGLLVHLESETGLAGHGDAMPLAGFGLETLDAAGTSVATAVGALVGDEIPDLDAAIARVEHHTVGTPSARAALDVALHDLFARAADASLAAWLCRTGPRAPHRAIPVNALIVADDDAAAARHARQATSRGFRALKLKVGVGDPGRDVERAAAVRGAAGSEVELRLDANGAWDEATAHDVLERVAPLEIAFVEQPVAAGDLDALARLRAAAPVPIAADESVRDEERAQEIIERKAADVLIVKPAAVGGLRPAQRIAERALAAGLGVVVTGLLDSGLGTAAALHLAAALPGPLRAAGLATDGLLQEDPTTLPRVRAGERDVPAGPGLGVAPRPKSIARLATGPAQEFHS